MKNNPQYLYELLREKRNKIASDNNVEPYMILHNKVLQAIAEKKPATLEELKSIKGLGKKRIAKYGNTILEIVNGTITREIQPDTQEKVFTVYEYITYLNQILSPKSAVLVGEITSIDDRGRFIYFTLHDKDEEASLKCFIWQSTINSLGIELKEGLEIKIAGFPKVYEKYGSLSFEVQHIGLVGEGVLKLAFEKLKNRLEKEGYFDIERKKQIPGFVQTIGLITSSYADAYKDFITHLGNYGFKIFFYEVRVEGLYALDEIISAIHWLNENITNLDVLVITRGGGSLESLQPFYSEAIAKAIFGSKIPVITGIGHENDTTIADLVADFRASTPTDAAKILSDPWKNVTKYLNIVSGNISSLFLANFKNYITNIESSEKNLYTSVKHILNTRLNILNNLQNNLGYQFDSLIQRVKQIQLRFSNNQEILKGLVLGLKKEIISLEKTLLYEGTRWFTYLNNRVLNIEQKLNLGNPKFRLKQGYSIIMGTDKSVIKSHKQIKIGDALQLKFYQGGATSKVEDIEE